MVDYNPHRTQVLGNEWAPIKQANYTPDKLTELGYTYTQLANTPGSLQGASFTVAGLPQFSSRHTAQVIGVYPAGQEANTGPVYEMVVTPDATSAVITGGPVSFYGGAVDMADALASPNDLKGFLWLNDIIEPVLYVRFDFTPVLPAGRRILSVDLEYQLEYPEGPSARKVNAFKDLSDFAYSRVAVGGGGPAGTAVITLVRAPEESVPDSQLVQSTEIGELNHFWEGVDTLTTEVMPWTSTSLGWFSAAAPAANRMAIWLSTGDAFNPSNPILGNFDMGYLALRIRYCAEQRVRFGGWATTQGRDYSPVTAGPPNGLGTQFCHLRDPATMAKAVLAAGTYTITQTNVYSPFVDAPSGVPGVPPPMAALRQLRNSPAPPATNGALLPGVQVNRTITPGQVFSKETTDVIVPLTLGQGTLPAPTGVAETHGYALQFQAPVYGAITASQLVATSYATGQNYNRIRFYARRVGNPGSDLVVASVETPAATATLTPAAFDALPEIIDGWRQVDLVFAANVTIAAASTRTIRWTSSGANEGTQWQILGSRAKTMTAIGNGTGAWDLAPMTYGGSSQFASWKPPHLATIQTDLLGDITFMLSATPVPAVTALAAAVGEQAVPVTTPLCGDTEACCIVTAIKFVDLSWTASTLGASQFAHYLIQRLGTDAVTWETIGTSTNVARTTYRDREARVGVLESYRVITVDGAGAQGISATVTATIPGPGVTIGCTNATGILILTSNMSNQITFTLAQAWKMIWDGSVEEGFRFPEAGENELQRMYQRDYRVAFRPTERGGVEFERDLLIDMSLQAPIIMENFTRLRDIAWADIPYICVRDEMGNRWYMSIEVPAGTILRQGNFSFVPGVRFAQVTATPAPAAAP